MNLLNHPFFAHFSDIGARALADYTEEITCNNGTLLFDEADPSDCIYLLLEGQVELSKVSGGSQQIHLATVEAGNFFGEMGILDDNLRSARATCMGVVRIAKIPGPPLLRILQQEPAYVTLQLLRTILGRLRHTNDRFVKEVLKNHSS